MSIFKNKGKQAEGTTKNHHIKNIFRLGWSDSDDRLCSGFNMVTLRALLKYKKTDKEDIINYKKELNKNRKEIVKSYDGFGDYCRNRIMHHYAKKYLLNVCSQLAESDFKRGLSFAIGCDILDGNSDDKVERTNLIGNSAYHTSIANNYVEEIRHRFYLAFESAYLRGLKNYATSGKYEVRKYFGSLNFADNFELNGCSDRKVNLTLPHSYKTEVMGSGLEVIDNKYLTVTLKEYNSIIVNCEMYHADVLKVIKPFNASEIEQMHIAKLDDTVLYAKTNQLLTKKVLKHFEEVNELGAVACIMHPVIWTTTKGDFSCKMSLD